MLRMQRLVRQAVLGLTRRRQRAAWLAWLAACAAAVAVREGAAQLQLRVVQRLRNRVRAMVAMPTCHSRVTTSCQVICIHCYP